MGQRSQKAEREVRETFITAYQISYGVGLDGELEKEAAGTEG